MGKTIYRMIEQPRFRAACDFLQLRAAAGEFDSVLAQWWMDLANADDDLRGEMIEEVSRLPRDPADAPASTSANRRRRRPRRSPRSARRQVSDERGSRARLYRARRQPGRQRGHPQDGAGRTAPDAWHRRRDRLALLPHRSGRGHRPRLRQRRRGAGHHAGAAGTAGRAAGPELRHGRERPYKNAPRTLDLDMLLHGDQSLEDQRLVLPHPRMHLRAFVLRPLLDLAPPCASPAARPPTGWPTSTTSPSPRCKGAARQPPPHPDIKPGTTPGPTPASRIEAARCQLGRSVAAPC